MQNKTTYLRPFSKDLEVETTYDASNKHESIFDSDIIRFKIHAYLFLRSDEDEMNVICKI